MLSYTFSAVGTEQNVATKTVGDCATPKHFRSFARENPSTTRKRMEKVRLGFEKCGPAFKIMLLIRSKNANSMPGFRDSTKYLGGLKVIAPVAIGKHGETTSSLRDTPPWHTQV